MKPDPLGSSRSIPEKKSEESRADLTNRPSTSTSPKSGYSQGPVEEGIPFPLWGDVVLVVYPENRGTYPIEFRKGDNQLFSEAPKSQPWLSKRLQGKLVTSLESALGEEARRREFMQRKIGEVFFEIANLLETDDGTKRALTPAPVRRIIEETESVTVYPGETTEYEVKIKGRTLTISSAQMSRNDPGHINEAMLNAFPLSPLDASRDDWKKIKEYWLSPDVAEIREVEEATESEFVIDRLRMYLELVPIFDDSSQVIGDHLAWFDRDRDLVWFQNTRIGRFITEELKKPSTYSSVLSKILRTARVMPAPSTKRRGIGKHSKAVRCWGFVPSFLGVKDIVEAPPPLFNNYQKSPGWSE